MLTGKEERGEKKIAIFGAGLAGSLLAIHLADFGYQVDVYEGRGDSRLQDTVWEGKSINLALSERGLTALRAVGLDKEVTEKCVKMKCRAMHAQTAEQNLHFMQYGAFEHEHIWSMERRMLNEKLMDRAEKAGARFHFNHKVNRFEARHNRVHLRSPDGDVVLSPDVVVAADGAFSRIRAGLTRNPRVEFQQLPLPHGYKELSISGDNFDKLAPMNALHIWPRGNFMMIALPNPDRTWTLTLFMPWSGEEGFESITTPDQVLAFFTKYFPDVIPLMPNLLDEYFQNEAAPLVTMRLNPWHLGDRCVVVGDAAHAIVPFYGQGMNCSLEDVDVLVQLLNDTDHCWETALPRYSLARKPQGDAISALSHRNYIEMRSDVRSQWFLLKQKLDRFLHRWLGDRWLPLYEMVAFKTIPYSEAIERDRRQTSIFNWVVNCSATALALAAVAGGLFAFRHSLPRSNL